MRTASSILIVFSLTCIITEVTYAQLSGVKTIGGSSPDYATFSDAVSALNTNGVGTGGVTFLFRNGTYTGGIEITASGAADKPIVFKSESEDSTAVTISLNALDDVIDLTGVSYISFEHLTISYLKASACSTIEIGTSSNYVSIKNCVLQSIYSSTSNAGALIYGSESTNDCSNLLVENCRLIGGSYGIYFKMSSASPQGPTIQNNIIENFYDRAIELSYFTAITIKNNNIRTKCISSYGIRINYCYGSSNIENNYIYTTESGQFDYGIYMVSSSSVESGTPAKLYNNSIQVENGSTIVYGIFQASSCNYWNICNNTIYISGGTSSTTYGYYNLTPSSYTVFKNNVIANYATGTSPYTIYAPNTNTITEIDNNCYYTNSGTYFYGTYDTYSGNNFISFTDDTGETNSLNIDPEFEFVTDVGWKATATSLSGAGAYLSDVTSDIDGDPRPNPPSIGAHELASAPPDDAGILSVDAPEKPFAASLNDVFVTLKNFGSDALTSVTIEWEVNSSSQTDFSWTGNLASGAETSVNIGSYNFSADVVYTITVRTNLPNGNTDGAPSNDEITLGDLRAGLSGNYTIGSGEDFTDFTTTISALENYGIANAVVFNVASNTYNEQITITNIEGSSSSNTITFKSQSGTAEDVILTSASDYVVGSSTLELESASNTIWQDISIERTGTATYANVVIISGASQNNTFNNVIFSGRTGSYSDYAALVLSNDVSSGNSEHSFLNCTFNNGSSGIWFDSNSSNYKSNLTIKNCHFENYRYGILLQYIENATIDNNTIINASSYNSAATTGIDLSYVSEILLIRKNEIIKTEGTSNYGIHMMACVTEYGGPNDPGEISNNMITVGGTGSGTSNGIYTNGTKNKNFYFNSIYTTGANATTAKAMYVNGPYSSDPVNNANFVFKNNVFMADYGIPMYNSVGGIISCDYNNYYAVNNVAIAHWDAAGDVETIAELQAANSDDANSISENPLFVSDSNPFDLHITKSSPCIDNATSISGISDDIDGDTRNPDIGADELDAPTPVELISFNADCKNGKVFLSWTTASEINNDYFVIEISRDAKQFDTIGYVDGSGNSNNFKDYFFEYDKQTYSDVYYRLKQVDFDGTYSFSNIITNICEVRSVEFYSNSLKNNVLFITSEYNFNNVDIKIIDITGKIIHSQKTNLLTGENKIIINNNIKNGLYIITIVLENFEVGVLEKILVF